MEFLKQVWGILTQYWGYLLSGVGVTMLIALTGTVFGFLIGLITGVVRTEKSGRFGFEEDIKYYHLGVYRGF